MSLESLFEVYAIPNDVAWKRMGVFKFRFEYDPVTVRHEPTPSTMVKRTPPRRTFVSSSIFQKRKTVNYDHI